MKKAKKSPKADRKLDATGLMCPMPIAEAAKVFEKMGVGEILEVVADDEGIKEDMPEWCRTTGNELLGIEEEEGLRYHVYVKKRVEHRRVHKKAEKG